MVPARESLSVKAALAAFVLAGSSLALAPSAFAEKYASIVIDADTDEVLHARHADAPRYPASLTKVMTLYMLFDALKSGEVRLDEKLKVSKFAAAQAPSNLKLKKGDTITVNSAIKSLVTKSANDVAVVVAERLGGSERRFATLMTVKAKDLGMKNTRFTNASGLPDTRQKSTARDLAVLAEALMEQHGDYYHYFSTKKFRWGKATYKNHNKLLGEVPGVDGIKTGYTRASGFNLMTSARRDGRRVVVIMLGGRTSKSRNTHVEALVEAAYDEIEKKPAPGLRMRMAFEDVITPTNPDDAAIPMLNGKPFNAIAQGSTSEEPTVQQRPITLASVNPVRQPTTKTIRRVTHRFSKPLVAVKPVPAKAPPTVKITTKKSAPIVKGVTTNDKAAAMSGFMPVSITQTPAPAKPAVPEKTGLTVAEYEARQLRLSATK